MEALRDLNWLTQRSLTVDDLERAAARGVILYRQSGRWRTSPVHTLSATPRPWRPDGTLSTKPTV